MSDRIWPPRLAVREGVATARSGRWTSLLVVVAVTWLIAAPGAVDAVDVSRIAAAEREWLAAGGHVFVVTGTRTEAESLPIPGEACDRLTQIDGVEASFALSRTNAVGTLSHVPGGRTTLYDVSPGAWGFLGINTTSGPTVLVTDAFANRTGIRDGEDIVIVRQGKIGTTPETSDPIAATIVDPRQLGGEYDGSLLIPTPTPVSADVCYVRTDATHLNAVEAALPTWLAWEGSPAIANPRLFESEFTVEFTSTYEDRQLRWAWVAAAGVLALLWALVQWFRRSQVAIYTTFGARADARLVMQATEWGVLSAVGFVWGWSLGVVAALAFGAEASFALTQVTWHAALTALAASAVVVLLGLRPSGTVLAALKDS